MTYNAIISIFAISILIFGGYTAYNSYNRYTEDVYPCASGDSWCDTACAKRIDVNINNTAGSALTYYQVYVDLTSNPINETSLRVYNTTSCTLRSHWSENTTGGNSYGIWVNYSAIAASTWTNNTAIYYDNVATNSVSDITTTFLLGDDFSGEYTGFAYVSEQELWNGSAPYDELRTNDLLNVSGTWVAVYIQGESHTNNSIHKAHIHFSTDEGITWSDADKNIDGTDVDGFPISGNQTGHGIAESRLIHAPNGDLVFLVTDRNAANCHQGTRQFRSTNTGKNWTAEGEKFDSTCAFIVDYAIVNTTIYITMFHDPSTCHTGTSNAKLYNSSNNGTSWSFVSNIATGAEEFAEASIEYLGNDEFLTVIRWGTGGQHPHTRKSTDLGETWGALVDITSQVGALQGGPYLVRLPEDQDRIYLLGRDYPSASTSYTVLFYTVDNGTTWLSKFNPDDTSPNVDEGYPRLLKRTNGQYYLIAYTGTLDISVVKEYIFEADPDKKMGVDTTKWDSYVGNVASQECRDGILFCNTTTTSGNGHSALISKQNVSEETILTARTRNTATGNSNNRYTTIGYGCNEGGALYLYQYTAEDDSILFRDYSSGNNFWHAEKYVNGAETGYAATISISTSWKNYTIERHNAQSRWLIAGTEYQGFEDTPNGSYPIVIGQDTYPNVAGLNITSMLIDWVYARKYTSLEPSTTLGSEEDAPESTPVISNVVNGSLSPTSQYVDWDVNQTAHNRVLYSNESDLTPAWYSTWGNSTAAPNITLSALTASTQYWYQAWSYNVTNTSLSANSSTSSFTTAAGTTKFEQIVKTGAWQYIAHVNATAQYPWQLNTTLGTNVSYVTMWNATAQRWNTTWMADWNNTILAQVAPGNGFLAYFAQDDIITRDNCVGGLNWSFPTATGYSLTGLDYNGTRTLTQINTSLSSPYVSEIVYMNETGTEWVYTYGSTANGTIEVKQGQSFWCNTSGAIEKARVW